VYDVDRILATLEAGAAALADADAKKRPRDGA
jgi:hypothetical protein